MAQVIRSTPPRTPQIAALNTLINPAGRQLLLVLTTVLLSAAILLLRRRIRHRQSYYSNPSDLETDYKAILDPLHRGETLSADDVIPPPLRSIYKHECYTADTIAPLYEQAFTRRHSYPLASAASVKWDHVEVFAAKLTDQEQTTQKPAAPKPEVWRRRTLIFEQ